MYIDMMLFSLLQYFCIYMYLQLDYSVLLSSVITQIIERKVMKVFMFLDNLSMKYY